MINLSNAPYRINNKLISYHLHKNYRSILQFTKLIELKTVKEFMVFASLIDCTI